MFRKTNSVLGFNPMTLFCFFLFFLLCWPESDTMVPCVNIFFQGIPLKYESSSSGASQSAIKHNVKSLLTSPGKLEEPKVQERVRHTSVVSSTSVLRSTHQEASKAQLSPGMYEDANARRTPNYTTSSISRGSPLLRAQEGTSPLFSSFRSL